MGPGLMRSLLALGAAVVLVGCETTSGDFAASNNAPGGSFARTEQSSLGNGGMVTTTSAIDPTTGQRVVTGGSFAIGSGNTMAVGAMLGSWTLGDDFARRCSLSLTSATLASSGGAMEVQRTGFCSNEFSNVAGWMTAGSGIALTDASGRIQGQLVSDNRGGYAGTYNTMFGPNAVKLTRGGF